MALSITRRVMALILGLIMVSGMLPLGARATEVLSATITPVSSEVAVNQPMTGDFTISGGTPPYSFNYYWVIDYAYTFGQGTGTEPAGSLTFTPQFGQSGELYMDVYDSAGGYAFAYSPFTITGSPVVDLLDGSITLDKATVIAGQTITAEWVITGGTPPYSIEYYWDVLESDGTNYTAFFTSDQAAGSSSLAPPTGVSGYFYLQLVDSVGRDLFLSSPDPFDITGSPSPLTAEIILDNTMVVAGSAVTATWSLSGGAAPYSTEYYWWTLDASGETNGPKTTTSELSGTSTFTDTYGVQGALVLDVTYGSGVHKWFYGDFTIVEPLVINSVTSNVASTTAGQPIVWTIAASGGSISRYYGFKVLQDGVQVYNTGLVLNLNSYSYTPTQPGVYTVIATVSDLVNEVSSEQTAAVTVEPAPPAMYLYPGSFSLVMGATQQLTAEISPVNTGNEGLTWDTSNASVATVSATGLVTGVSAGRATITATSPAMLTATASVIVKANVPVQSGTLTYNGQIQQPTFAPSAGGYYTWNGGTQSATNAGTYYAIAWIIDWTTGGVLNSPTGVTWNLPPLLNLERGASAAWTIAKLDLSTVTIAPVAPQAYTGSAIHPTPEVSISGNVLQPGVDFIYQYQTNTNPGTYTITIIPTPNNNTMGSKSIIFNILHVPLTPPAAVAGLVYNGSAQTGVPEGSGYSLTGNTGTDAGDYNATATLANTALNVWDDLTAGPKTIPWSIAPRPIALSDFSYNNSNQQYTGSPLTLLSLSPTGFVTANDYDVVYTNNTDVGTATATITGKGNYTGSVQITFLILPLYVSPPAAESGLVYNGTEQTGVVAAPWYTLSGNTGTNAGDYTATAFLTPLANQWSDGTTAPKTIPWSIGKAAYNMSGAGWEYTSPFAYDGALKTVEVAGLPAGVTAASYTGNTAADIGAYTASVTLAYDTVNYLQPAIADLAWEIAAPVVITMHPAPKITKTEALSATSLKLTWTKVSGATGYEIWRSTTNTGVYAPIGKTASLTFSNTGLKAGTRYFYKIRTYDTVAGEDAVSSGFSAIAAGVPLAKSAITRASGISTSQIKLVWTKVAGATGYQVFRSSSAAGTYTSIKKTSSLSLIATGLKAGKTYYFKVKPYRVISSVAYYGPISAYKAGRTLR